MKILYYYCFIFYTKILPDNQPHATVIFTLSFLISLIINGMLNITFAILFGFALNKWEMLSILGVISGLMYLYFYRSGKGNNIILGGKPKVFGSQTLSLYISILVLIISILFLFFEPDITGKILHSR